MAKIPDPKYAITVAEMRAYMAEHLAALAVEETAARVAAGKPNEWIPDPGNRATKIAAIQAVLDLFDADLTCGDVVYREVA